MSKHETLQTDFSKLSAILRVQCGSYRPMATTCIYAVAIRQILIRFNTIIDNDSVEAYFFGPSCINHCLVMTLSN